MKTIITVLVTLLLIMSLGCAGTLKWISDNESNLQLAVDVAVAAVVDAHPADAAIIGKIATAVITDINAAQNVTVASLNKFVVDQISIPNLTATDKVILAALLDKLDGNLTAYFQKQGITDAAKQVVVVKDIANMILQSLGSPKMAAHLNHK